MDPELENVYYLDIGNTLETFVQRAIKDGKIIIIEEDADYFVVYLDNQLAASLNIFGFGSRTSKLLKFYQPVLTEHLTLLEPIEPLFDTVYTSSGLPDDYFNKLPNLRVLISDTITTTRDQWMQVYLDALKQISAKQHLPAELNRLISSYLIK